jgi:hypothetical protein
MSVRNIRGALRRPDYEEILETELDLGKPRKEAERIAAATMQKIRLKETTQKKK